MSDKVKKMAVMMTKEELIDEMESSVPYSKGMLHTYDGAHRNLLKPELNAIITIAFEAGERFAKEATSE